MSKHDSWVFTEDPAFESVKSLFPEGIPVRDPFPMIPIQNELRGWIIDDSRLSEEQTTALIEAIARKHNLPPFTIESQLIDTGFLCVDEKSISRKYIRPEGFCRLIEFVNFTHNASPEQKTQIAVWREFEMSQYERWIDGDEKPDIKAAYESLPDELKDESITETYKRFLVEELLSKGNYSVFDMLSGTAMVDILNEVDPDSEYSLVSDLEIDDDYEEF